MATTPGFASTVVAGFVTTTATAATGYGPTGPTAGNLNTILQAGPTGAKIEEIDVIQVLYTGTTGGRVNIWRSATTGSTGPYSLVDQFVMTPVVLGPTTGPQIVSHYYTNLFLNPNDTLTCSIMETQNVSAFQVNGYG